MMSAWPKPPEIFSARDASGSAWRAKYFSVVLSVIARESCHPEPLHFQCHPERREGSAPIIVSLADVSLGTGYARDLLSFALSHGRRSLVASLLGMTGGEKNPRGFAPRMTGGEKIRRGLTLGMTRGSQTFLSGPQPAEATPR